MTTVNYNAALTIDDIGVVPDITRLRLPEGVFGEMNWGMIQYDAALTPTGKPSSDDINSLATVYNLGRRTIKSWFGIPFQDGTVEYRNCVPIHQIPEAATRLQGPSTLGVPLARLTSPTRFRCYLAATLATDGLVRDPIFTRTRDARGNPYVLEYICTNLGDAAEQVASVIDGYIGPIEEAGWLQINVLPSSAGWVVRVIRSYPNGNQYDTLYASLKEERGETDG